MALRPRNTLTFVLPYKRYAATELLPLAQHYLDQSALSLRQATRQPKSQLLIVHAEHPKAAALSHTTLHRWLTFLGAMTASLAIGGDLFMQAYPSANIHLFDGAVDPHKARSPDRLKSLSNARRLLYLRSRWDATFKQTAFFPRFATRVRPP